MPPCQPSRLHRHLCAGRPLRAARVADRPEQGSLQQRRSALPALCPVVRVHGDGELIHDPVTGEIVVVGGDGHRTGARGGAGGDGQGLSGAKRVIRGHGGGELREVRLGLSLSTLRSQARRKKWSKMPNRHDPSRGQNQTKKSAGGGLPCIDVDQIKSLATISCKLYEGSLRVRRAVSTIPPW